VVRSNSTFYGDVVCEAATSDRDGMLYLSGTLDNRKSFDVITFKYDPAAGETLWTAVWDGPDGGPDGPVGCVADTMGNLYVAAYSHNGDDFDLAVLKYATADGQLKWEKRINTGVGCNEYPAGLALDGAGALFVAATCEDDSLWNRWWEKYSPLLVKYDCATGDTLWSRLYNDIDTTAEATDIVINTSGDLIVACTKKEEYPLYYSMMAMKIDTADGDTIWNRYYHYYDLESHCAGSDDSGNIYLAGTQGIFDLFLIKADASDGDTIWTRTLSNLTPTDCVVESSGCLYTATRTSSFGTYKVIKWSTTGGMIWVSTGEEGGVNWQYEFSCPFFLAPADDGGCWLAATADFWNEEDYTERRAEAWGLKVDPTTGDTSNTFHLANWITGGWNTAKGCQVGGDGRVYVAGSSDQNYMVRCHDADGGNTIWETSIKYCAYGDRMMSEANDIVTSDDGNIFASGYSPLDLMPSPYGARTRAFSAANGDSLWSAPYTGVYTSPDVFGFCRDASGFLYIVGHEKYMPWASPNNSFVVKMDPTCGDTLWARDHEYIYPTLLQAVCTDDSGRVYVAGAVPGADVVAELSPATGDTLWTRHYISLIGNPAACVAKGSYLYMAGGSSDFKVAKLGLPACDTVWVRSCGGAAGGSDIGRGVAVDDSGYIYVTGTSSNGSNYDIMTVKFTPGGDTVWSARYDGPSQGNDFGEGCALDSLGNLFVSGYSRTDRGAEAVLIRYDAGFTGVQQGTAAAGAKYGLGRAFPNPWSSGKLTIDFSLGKQGQARLAVYNAAGQRVRTLADGPMEAGPHRIQWDGRNDAGRKVAAGVYICKAESGGWTSVRKLAVVR